MTLWSKLIRSSDIIDYHENRQQLVSSLHDKQDVLSYLEGIWLCKKEMFVHAFLTDVPHFENFTTSRCEGSHAAIKKFLHVSTGNLYEVYKKLSLAHHSQNREIQYKIESKIIRVQNAFGDKIFKNVVGKVSDLAIEYVRRQLQISNNGEQLQACRGVFRATMGMPCMHEINDFREFRDLHVSDFSKQWHLDHLVENTDEVIADIRASSDVDINALVQEPVVHQTRGRHPGSVNRSSNDTRRLPSAFERNRVIGRRISRCTRCHETGHNRAGCASPNFQGI